MASHCARASTWEVIAQWLSPPRSPNLGMVLNTSKNYQQAGSGGQMNPQSSAGTATYQDGLTQRGGSESLCPWMSKPTTASP
jgi:hypothetical protein